MNGWFTVPLTCGCVARADKKSAPSFWHGPTGCHVPKYLRIRCDKHRKDDTVPDSEWPEEFLKIYVVLNRKNDWVSENLWFVLYKHGIDLNDYANASHLWSPKYHLLMELLKSEKQDERLAGIECCTLDISYDGVKLIGKAYAELEKEGRFDVICKMLIQLHCCSYKNLLERVLADSIEYNTEQKKQKELEKRTKKVSAKIQQ